jgi:hypothetical protein
MATDTKTAADVERLHRALRSERELRKGAEREVAQLRAEMLSRLEALEQRQEGGVSMAQITAGLAAIRADLRGEVASLRAEVAEMAEQLSQFVRG